MASFDFCFELRLTPTGQNGQNEVASILRDLVGRASP